MCVTFVYNYSCGHPTGSQNRRVCASHQRDLDTGAAKSATAPCRSRNTLITRTLCTKCPRCRERDRRYRERKERDALREISGNRNDSREQREARRWWP